jgi:hypothetical protein
MFLFVQREFQSEEEPRTREKPFASFPSLIRFWNFARVASAERRFGARDVAAILVGEAVNANE